MVFSQRPPNGTKRGRLADSLGINCIDFFRLSQDKIFALHTILLWGSMGVYLIWITFNWITFDSILFGGVGLDWFRRSGLRNGWRRI